MRLITNRQHIVTGLVVTFSKQLNPTTATNLLNYGYSVRTAGRNHIFGTRDDLIIPITKAVYNSTNLTVTLTLGRGIHPPTPFRFTINQSTAVAGRCDRPFRPGWQPLAGESDECAWQPLCGHSQREGGRDHWLCATGRCRRTTRAAGDCRG